MAKAKEELTVAELCDFQEHVMKSTAKRYRGNLFYFDTDTGERIYVPAEEDEDSKGDVWDLLVELWGEHITMDELERIREQLLRDGLEREYWPLAYCEEEEREQPVSDYNPEDETADYFEALAGKI